ncbi:MAG: hypothetical protein ACI93N_002095 [Flavobacteriaceae bacterium]|jgi:hypothetical protein
MKQFLSVFIIILLLGCKTENPNELEYSFFVAGHTYGSPIAESKKNKKLGGLHIPFKDKFSYLRAQPKLKKGFLLGDVVHSPKDWKKTLIEIDSLGIPIDIARGNHDGNLKSFEKKFGKSYKKYIEGNNLFIILDTNLDLLNIKNEQLDFLKTALKNDIKNVKNIFILSHHLFWYSEDKIPTSYPNSLHKSKTEGKMNFWTTIEPLLVNLKQEVYIFSGDVGAFKSKRWKVSISEYYYHEYNNITFIATGMGAGEKDNIIIIDVFDNDSIEFRLLHLNSDKIDSLGKLEDYPNFKSK